MTSESPTHPDAPRAGGETPPLDVEACVRLLESLASEGEDLYADAGAAALLSTVAAALRGIEKDRADAARWRFWRPRYLAADFDYGDPPVPVVVFRLPARFAVGADPDLTTDVLIDAARSVKPDVDVMQAEIAIYFSEVERLRASLLERHRDGERDTRLLDWLTASCRDLIHSEGGKWEVIEYPGDPLVEERRAIGNTPREALIVAGALRVAHPYDAPAASPPAASDGTWVDIERIKPNCMPPLFDEKRPPAASDGTNGQL